MSYATLSCLCIQQAFETECLQPACKTMCQNMQSMPACDHFLWPMTISGALCLTSA